MRQAVLIESGGLSPTFDLCGCNFVQMRGPAPPAAIEFMDLIHAFRTTKTRKGALQPRQIRKQYEYSIATMGPLGCTAAPVSRPIGRTLDV